MSDDAGLSTNITIFLAVYSTAAATLTQPVIADGLYTFNVSGVPGYEYIVQVSANLTDWVSVQTNIAPFSFTDLDTQQFTQRFYRSLATLNFSTDTNTTSSNVAMSPAPPATLTQVAYGNGQYSFMVAGESNYEYVVQTSTNLVDWISVQTNLAPFTLLTSDAGHFGPAFLSALSASGISASVSIQATESAMTASSQLFDPHAGRSNLNFLRTY